MDFWIWVQTVGAVFAGCLLAGVFFYAFVIVYRLDMKGGSDWGDVPVRALLAWTAPLAFLTAVIYSLH